MNKKIKFSILSAVAMLLLSGCGNANNPTVPSETTDVPTQPTVQPTTQPTVQPTTSQSPADYYASINDSMSGSTLQSALKSIINNTGVSVSYSWSRFEACDQDPNKSSNVLMVYARTSVPKSSHVSGNTGWNREHSFPQSKMESAQAKSDNHIIFASDNKVNGARSNYRLGDLSNKSPNIKDGYGNSTPCKLYDKGGEKIFDPGDTPARGEVARATLYSAVMYDYIITENFESIALCLQWALSYPVANRDIYRNNTVYKYQRNRNPFVDHPEYACRIWGSTNSATRAACGY